METEHTTRFPLIAYVSGQRCCLRCSVVLPSGAGASSCFSSMPSFTRHSTYLGSSSGSRVIWGFARGAFSGAASLVAFLAVLAVVGQYPGPVSAPSLLAMRTTSNSFVSAMVRSSIRVACAVYLALRCLSLRRAFLTCLSAMPVPAFLAVPLCRLPG